MQACPQARFPPVSARGDLRLAPEEPSRVRFRKGREARIGARRLTALGLRRSPAVPIDPAAEGQSEAVDGPDETRRANVVAQRLAQVGRDAAEARRRAGAMMAS